MSTISIEWNYPYTRDYQCRCENCMKVMRSGKLDPISDAEQRLTPGEETPAGQCPDCFGLVYVFDEKKGGGTDEPGIQMPELPEAGYGIGFHTSDKS